MCRASHSRLRSTSKHKLVTTAENADSLCSYDQTATHLLLTTPITSPPDVSTSSITPSIDPTPSSISQKPIGTIRWNPEVGKVARLVVGKDYRKYGFGRLLMEELHEYIADTPEDRRSELKTLKEEFGKQVVGLWLHSQVRR